VLFLLAWLRLGATAERGPEFISMTPEMPEGVVLPNGADPAAIGDPELRRQAEEAVERHRREIERWNAKQRALDHLNRLAILLERDRPAAGDDENLSKEMAAAMALAPGLPLELRRSLERRAS
jgi:hypothetical protein